MKVLSKGSGTRAVAVVLACAALQVAAQAQGPGATLAVVEARAARLGHAADVVITAVSDGDTATAVIEGRPLRLRLARIDAPEHRQAWGQRAEQSLRQLVWKKQVHIEWREVDRNGRPIVTMTVDGLDVSEEQVRRGMAWVYRAYSKDPQLLRLEADAREARLGLWADAAPLPPWEWRRMKRDGEALQ